MGLCLGLLGSGLGLAMTLALTLITLTLALISDRQQGLALRLSSTYYGHTY